MQPIVSDVIVDRPPRPLVMIGGGVTCADCSERACASSPEAKASPRAVSQSEKAFCHYDLPHQLL